MISERDQKKWEKEAFEKKKKLVISAVKSNSTQQKSHKYNHSTYAHKCERSSFASVLIYKFARISVSPFETNRLNHRCQCRCDCLFSRVRTFRSHNSLSLSLPRSICSSRSIQTLSTPFKFRLRVDLWIHFSDDKKHTRWNFERKVFQWELSWYFHYNLCQLGVQMK